jgi:hypothetical protein
MEVSPLVAALLLLLLLISVEAAAAAVVVAVAFVVVGDDEVVTEVAAAVAGDGGALAAFLISCARRFTSTSRCASFRAATQAGGSRVEETRGGCAAKEGAAEADEADDDDEMSASCPPPCIQVSLTGVELVLFLLLLLLPAPSLIPLTPPGVVAVAVASVGSIRGAPKWARKSATEDKFALASVRAWSMTAPSTALLSARRSSTVSAAAGESTCKSAWRRWRDSIDHHANDDEETTLPVPTSLPPPSADGCAATAPDVVGTGVAGDMDCGDA